MTKTDASLQSSLDDLDLNDVFTAVSAPTDGPSGPPPAVLFPEGKHDSFIGGGGEPSASSPYPNDGDEKDLFSLLCIEHPHDASAICGGKIAGSQFRFCTKPKFPNVNCCTTTKHRSQFHSLPHGRFYIVKNSTSAFVSPSVELSKMTIEQIHNFKQTRKPIDSWRKLFSLINNAPESSADSVLSETNRKLHVLASKLPLKTPLKIKSETKVTGQEDESFFEAEDEQKFSVPQDTGDEWDSLPESFRSFFGKFVSAVADINANLFGVARDVRGLEKMNALVGQDLEALDIHLRATQDQLGDSIAVGGIEAPTVSAAMDIISERVHITEERLDVIDITLADNLKEAGEKFETFTRSQRQNWKRITPLILQIKDVIRANLKNPLGSLADRISQLETQIEDKMSTRSIHPSHLKTTKKSNRNIDDLDDEFRDLLEPEDETLVTNDTHSTQRSFNKIRTPNPNSEDIFERLRVLEDNVATLQARSVTDGVRVQHHTFQSKEELKEWVKLHLTGCRFGIFLDGVSIWEYFSQSHQNMSDVINTFRDTARIGFSTIHEGKVATSFQNVLPGILGKGQDTSLYLPGLPSHKRWNAGNGSSGLRFHITQELPGVNTQVLNNIDSTLSDPYSPARNLAIECLQRSMQFVAELSAYISRFYDELKCSGSFSEDQCWQLVCRCIKRCFQDMSSVRVTARDIKHAKDRDATATEYIWATMKTHAIMEEYVRHNFEDHPSFASVITRFVTNNSFQSDLKDILSRLDRNEKDLKALSKRVDTAYNKLSKLE